ncbi:hypothetical protein GDO78_003595 [Eleutherodactylus coqui]|uniref:Uncharacterized protein n=1 Tax=Eleutherodactylus coqui TaxID=57060 RepID=A0A8J6ETT3_ELECQ|nr:hypothetical protein GDO78_003595 [Eleutherodactylus coqui]
MLRSTRRCVTSMFLGISIRFCLLSWLLRSIHRSCALASVTTHFCRRLLCALALRQQCCELLVLVSSKLNIPARCIRSTVREYLLPR